MEKRGYKVSEVREILNYSRSTVYDLIKKGILLTYGRGPGLRVRVDSVEAFIMGGSEHPPIMAPAKISPRPTRRRAGTVGESDMVGRFTLSQIRARYGPKLDLES